MYKDMYNKKMILEPSSDGYVGFSLETAKLISGVYLTDRELAMLMRYLLSWAKHPKSGGELPFMDGDKCDRMLYYIIQKIGNDMKGVFFDDDDDNKDDWYPF